jgi:hypothetical protein
VVVVMAAAAAMWTPASCGPMGSTTLPSHPPHPSPVPAADMPPSQGPDGARRWSIPQPAPPPPSVPACPPGVPSVFWPPLVPGDGWRRCGEDVCYIPNKFIKLPCGSALSPPPPLPPQLPPQLPSVVSPVALDAGSAAGVAGSMTPSLGAPVGGGPGTAATAGMSVAAGAGAGAGAGGAAGGGGGSGSGSGSGSGNDGEPPSLLRQGSVFVPQSVPASQQHLYSEGWSMVFPPGTTTAFFAYCQPYTMTDLLLDLARWEGRARTLQTGAHARVHACVWLHWATVASRACDPVLTPHSRQGPVATHPSKSEPP